MKINFEKVVWIISFIIVLILFYNLNILERIVDIVFQKSSVVQVDEYNDFDSDSVFKLDSIEVGDHELINEVEELTSNNLNIKVERLVWELEQVEEDLMDLKIQVISLSSEKSNTIDSIIAIVGALTPLLLPIITKKFKGEPK